ncbi:hypothetical protein H6G45_00705 [Synechocystis sp. FACHB-383]|nr:hypothetical protein [Synechocystis sp. FACHB-383]MBD2652033.1 hypothetical protein [Synechocystis sp. FACHB-383]
MKLRTINRDRLTTAQEKAIAMGWTIHVVRSPEEALALVDSTEKALRRD